MTFEETAAGGDSSAATGGVALETPTNKLYKYIFYLNINILNYFQTIKY